MTITTLPILKDNYAYIITFENGQTAVIDPGEAAPVIDFLEAHDLKLDLIINTHHHGDHIAGNAALKERYHCPLAAPLKEADKIGEVDLPLAEGHDLTFGGERGIIIETPGHTLGHICLHYPNRSSIFTGDTLFSMGCGRLFESTADMMFAAFQKLAKLPEDTLVYCGHEYTQSNAAFALHVAPENADIAARAAEVNALRAKGQPTIPTSIGLEKKTNVFFHCKTAQDFAALRARKDSF
ncbi:MAG: hydroxyacylglutathione hydrolase [Alphaproteobacteria bacterium]